MSTFRFQPYLRKNLFISPPYLREETFFKEPNSIHFVIRIFNPFAPEPPMWIHIPSTACDIISLKFKLTIKWSTTTLSTNLCRVKRSFRLYQNEHNSVKYTKDKRQKKTCSIDLKMSMKILFHYPPTFPFI